MDFVPDSLEAAGADVTVRQSPLRLKVGENLCLVSGKLCQCRLFQPRKWSEGSIG